MRSHKPGGIDASRELQVWLPAQLRKLFENFLLRNLKPGGEMHTVLRKLVFEYTDGFVVKRKSDSGWRDTVV